VSKTTGHAAHAGEAPLRGVDSQDLSALRKVRVWIGSAAAAFLGLLPHILHHAGPLAGAALLGGASGSLLFGAIGFIAAIPFMLHLRTRSGGWRLPAMAMAVFALVFSFSTFALGPAINESDSGGSAPSSQQQNGSPAPGESESAHESHH
jgi:predicted lipid-binding transport protein (Tim44 family)